MKLLIVALAALSLLAVACDDDDDGASNATPSDSTCATPGTSAPAGCWEEVLPPGNGGFMPYPGSGDTPQWEPGKYPMTLRPMIGFDSDLWMVSSTTLAFSSTDAVHWTKHDKNETPGRLASSTVFFDDKLWIYAGSDIPGSAMSNEIWSSTDGASWINEGNAEWPGRDSATFVTFDDKLWVFGGADHRDEDFTTDSFLNDVWSSEDGVHWTQVTAAAPWSACSYPRVVVRGDEMYMLGGEKLADVWKTTDGKNWEQLLEEAPWGGGRQGYAAEFFADKFWVFGGFVGDSKNGVNDIWYSDDGITWARQAEHAPWTPRDPIAIVFQGKLWLYAGKYTGSDDSWSGDLWQMTSAPTSPTTSP